MQRIWVLGLAVVLLSSGWAYGNFVAYNDCVYNPNYEGQAVNPIGQTTHYTSPNVTYYLPPSGSIPGDVSHPNSGTLKDKATGNDTGVTATMSSSGNPVWQDDNGQEGWTGGYDTAPGTDARNTFGGIVDMTGVVYYGDRGWWVEVEFTGLDPAMQYTFATSASRCNSSYTDRYTLYTLSGVDAATNASTPGTQEYGGPLAVWFNTGDNYNEGYVARWTGIDPGDDGTFKVRAEAHPNANDQGRKAYSFDVFMLEEVPEPTTLGLLALGGLALLRRR